MLGSLERVDARFLIPDLLGIGAELAYLDGDHDLATTRAERALAVAMDVEAARARAVLACVASTRGAASDARSLLQAITSESGTLSHHVEALRQEAERLVEAARRTGADEWQ